LKRLFFGLVLSLIILPLLVNSSFAQESYVINIVEGADNSDNQIFWHIPSSRNLQGELVITEGDSITWRNQDIVDHTVTSGSPETGPSGLFDSNLFGQDDSVTIEFTEAGVYPYFCTVHPWMIGTITVAEPYLGREQIIQNVGSEIDYTGNGVEVRYTLEGTLSDTVQINSEQNSVTFYYDPLESKEDILIIELPVKLIDDIQYTQVDGEIIGDAIREQIGESTTMWVPLWPDSKEVTFVGAKVISIDSTKGGGCLIATATYGSELAPQVQQLRELRDSKLLQTESGSAFMDSFNEFYYSFSPTIADLERENPAFKETVKLAITPMISTLSILNNVDNDSETQVIGFGISIILLNIGMYFVAPTIVIVGIKRKLGNFIFLSKKVNKNNSII